MKITHKILLAGSLGLAALTTQVSAQTTQTDKPTEPKTQLELDAINQSQQGLEVVRHADGSESVDLKGRFQMFSVAKVVNGEIVYSCQNHDQLGPDHQHGPALVATKRGEK
ncbi:hypothetical protein [Marinicella meishanensis]|uniref:hypothetical protein n=1 Tax=Marinicella meishanensis TaxID=2873263 RepID=UPI001CBB2A66|nr:hypothetical protein [Marinicella sp. NBU2979]